MPGSPSSPRGSPYNPRQCDHETLMCLVGAVKEPSRSISEPSFVLVGAHHWETLGSLPLDLSKRSMSLAEWRDRVLTSIERRVARPVEIAAAMRRGQLREMRHLWTRRIAQTGLAYETDDTPPERAIYFRITRAVEEMGRQSRETMEHVQLEEDLEDLEDPSEPFMDDTSEVSGVSDMSDVAEMPLKTAETATATLAAEDSGVDSLIQQVEALIKDFEAVIGSASVVVAAARQERRKLRKLHHALEVMGRDLAKKMHEDESDDADGVSEAEDDVLLKRQTCGAYADCKTTAPPRVPLDNPMPENAEQYHKCDCSKQTKAAKCIYCNDDAVFDGVYDNLI